MKSIKAWLEAITGRITMYRLLLATLGLLFVWSIVLSVVGELSYGVGELLLSAGALVVTSYITNLLLGRLYGLKPHMESSLITAGILFFVVSPGSEPYDYLVLFFIALTAMASKYVLAVRGRHIFNPAAAGVVIATMLNIGNASWWVAQPNFLAVVAASSFIILYKTRRLKMGGLFILIAVLLTMGESLRGGSAFRDIFPVVLTSFPIIYFAGFMLSEPLTLPPRHRQQLVYAAVVAVLVGLSPRIGGVFISPAVALLIGNALAFYYGQRRALALTLVQKRRLADMQYEFEYRPTVVPSFQAGQYIEITLPHKGADSRGVRRSFSITSAEGDETIKLGVKVPKVSSTFKRTLLAQSPGSHLQATLISGDFVLPKDTHIPLLYIAGGIGITPFISHLSTINKRDESRDVVLVYGVSDVENIAYQQELAALDVRVIVLSKELPAVTPAGWQFTGQDRLSVELLKTLIPDIAKRQAYISGPPAMVLFARDIVTNCKVTSVKTDYFTGY